MTKTRNLADLGGGFIQAGTGALQRTVESKLQDVVSVLDFIPESEHAAIKNGTSNYNATAAIQAAISAASALGRLLFFPDGNYLTGPLTVGAGCKGLIGNGYNARLTGNNVPNGGVLISATTPSDFTISGFTIDVDSTASPNASAIVIYNGVNCVVRDIRIADIHYNGIYLAGCSDCLVDNIRIESACWIGVYADTYATVVSNRISINNVSLTTKTRHHALQINGGSNHSITNCQVNTADQFGINLFNCNDCLISGNHVLADSIEGINVQDSYRIVISNNTVKCLSGHNDFGISLWGDLVPANNCVVSSNIVTNAGKAGIAVVATAATGGASGNTVIGNVIKSPNQLSQPQWGGITLYGGPLCTLNSIQSNTCIDSGSTMIYGAGEWDDGSGNPTNNVFTGNTANGAGVAVQTSNLTNNSIVSDVFPKTSSVAVAAGTGTITTASGSVRYLKIGNFVAVTLDVSITNNGTGSDHVLVGPLPITTIVGTLNGRENSLTGKQITGLAQAGGYIAIRNYDNSYPGGTGATLSLSGILYSA